MGRDAVLRGGPQVWRGDSGSLRELHPCVCRWGRGAQRGCCGAPGARLPPTGRCLGRTAMSPGRSVWRPPTTEPPRACGSCQAPVLPAGLLWLPWTRRGSPEPSPGCSRAALQASAPQPYLRSPLPVPHQPRAPHTPSARARQAGCAPPGAADGGDAVRNTARRSSAARPFALPEAGLQARLQGTHPGRCLWGRPSEERPE